MTRVHTRAHTVTHTHTTYFECRKVGKAYCALLDVLCHNHANVIATRDTSEPASWRGGLLPGRASPPAGVAG